MLIALSGQRLHIPLEIPFQMAEINSELKEFILKEFLPGESPEQLTDSTPLITGGILDSLATLKLVAFLEERYKIQVQAHEADVEHLNNINSIAGLVQSKL
jgi:acyl carrier protein